jgi:hypothetical protein
MLRSTKKQKSNDCHSFEIQERMLQKKKKKKKKRKKMKRHPGSPICSLK